MKRRHTGGRVQDPATKDDFVKVKGRLPEALADELETRAYLKAYGWDQERITKFMAERKENMK